MSGVGAWPKAGPGLTATLATGITLAVSLAVFQPFFYHENDDAAINMLATGARVPVAEAGPSEYLVFTHVAIGLVLKALYCTLPSVPWYGVYLAALSCVAAWTTAYAGVRLAEKAAGRIIAALLGSLVFVMAITNLQYTVSAALAAGSAVLLAFSALESPPSSRAGARLLIVSAFLLAWLGIMVRSEGGFLGIICVLPVLALCGGGSGDDGWWSRQLAGVGSPVRGCSKRTIDRSTR